MASNLKRSYNNITTSMLKLSNCFSPALTQNKIYPDINLRLTSRRNDIGNKGFHLKKKSQQILCKNKNDIMRTEPSNKKLLKVASNRGTINKENKNYSNIAHMKSFSDVNDIIQSLEKNSISSKGRNNYLSPTLIKLKTQKSKIKLMSYNETTERNKCSKKENEKCNMLLQTQPLTNISTKDSNSTTSMKRKSSKVLCKDKAACKLSFSDNVESPEEIHFMVVSTIQRGKEILAQFDY